MSHQDNIERIKKVNQALTDFTQEFVFVGGAVVSLYADRLAEEVRPTEDVDVVVEIYSTTDYTRMEEQLRSLGFQNDTTAKFVGRYTIKGLIVDFMPLKEEVLGFNNRWYVDAFKNAEIRELDEQNTIKTFSASYFVATKLEAFKSRGKNELGEYDGRLSSDFEDLVYIMVNRRSIWKEMAQAEKALKEYLQEEFTGLLNNPNFEEWVDAHTGYVSPAAQAIVLPQARKFIQSE